MAEISRNYLTEQVTTPILMKKGRGDYSLLLPEQKVVPVNFGDLLEGCPKIHGHLGALLYDDSRDWNGLTVNTKTSPMSQEPLSIDDAYAYAAEKNALPYVLESDVRLLEPDNPLDYVPMRQLDTKYSPRKLKDAIARTISPVFK